MGFMDISGQGNNYPILPIAVPAGSSFTLPAGQGIVGAFGAISTPQIGTNNPLSGQYFLQLGQYTTLQMYDDGMNYWQNVDVTPYALITISSDGANFRVTNSTGGVVGAVITGAGSGGTNGFYGYSQYGAGQGGQIVIQNGVTTIGNSIFTITPSAGGSLWNAIVGGAVNATISITGTVFNGNLSSQNPSGVGQSLNAFGQGSAAGGITASGGTNYTKAPLIVFTPPLNQGNQPYVLPIAVCTISGGVINSVTVIDQGAGLIALPGINVVPQPGDTTGGGAVLGWLFGATGTAGLGAGTGSGSVLAMWPYYSGTAVTLGLSPTIAILMAAVESAASVGASVRGGPKALGRAPPLCGTKARRVGLGISPRKSGATPAFTAACTVGGAGSAGVLMAAGCAARGATNARGCSLAGCTPSTLPMALALAILRATWISGGASNLGLAGTGRGSSGGGTNNFGLGRGSATGSRCGA